MLKISQGDRDGVDAPELVMVASVIESTIDVDGDAIVRRAGHELLRVEPWGKDSVRVRVSALLEPLKNSSTSRSMISHCAALVSCASSTSTWSTCRSSL